MSEEFDLKSLRGLTQAEVQQRLRAEGYNELPSAKQRSVFAIALEVLKEPMFLLLLACGTIYLLLGDLTEALVLLSFVVLIMGITFFQERKTERALEALRDLSSPRALVLRDGKQQRIAGREVVRGDILLMAEGDRVPADAVLLYNLNLYADESLLTGEPVPVRKVTGNAASSLSRPGGDDLPFLYSGTMVVKGQGVAEVLATGLNTEIGKIGKALKTLVPEDTRLQKEIRGLVVKLALGGVALCVLIAVIYSLARQDWLGGILAGLTLAMAILPEEFPVILTIFLALGAWRIAQKQVLTRRVPAIETLGSATVLCVDKTGTLTQNRMSISRLWAEGQFYEDKPGDDTPLPEAFHALVEHGILASQRDPFDPMEMAFHNFGSTYLEGTEHLHANWHLLREYPLSQHLLALSHVWKAPGTDEYVIAAKGAPEAIADLCHLSPEETTKVTRFVSEMAGSGLRVLGVARACFQQPVLPDNQHDFNFELIGLVGLADPIRPTVPAAIQECYRAGIRVVMITGDYPQTAQSIAHQIGLSPNDEVITGPELDVMDEVELQRRIKHVNIFARVVPEQKLQLVAALKADGEVVAMTGDGVNDAPALKAANIGVAMGERGTDVARESAALVLLDDDFSSIVEAVKLGRRIWDNIRKAIAYTLAVHVPIAGLSFFPVLFNWPLLLLPVHIVFLEMIIDPACSIVFEAESEEGDVMNHPPRDPQESILGSKTLLLSILQGVTVLLVALVVYGIGLSIESAESTARGFAFSTLIAGNVALILVNRSWSRSAFSMLLVPNKALWWLLGGVTLFLGLALYVPFLNDLFQFSAMNPFKVLLCVIAGLLSVLWFEIYKLWKNRSGQNASQQLRQKSAN
ncbi:MAG TPA: cation-translocating P-type ATPase [Chloroflexia bacterium]|nr:cation-translocating P-type ATPase [Chloroflexia bacterium]